MRKLVIGMAMASTALASPALARDGQWYVELDGGVMIVEDLEFDVGAVDNGVSIDSDYGSDFGGIVGYDFGAFRLEAEASYKEADFDSIVSTTTLASRTVAAPAGTYVTDGDVNVLSFMLNGMFDFGPDDGLQGFIGGGAGVARVDTNAGIQVGSTAFDDSDTGLAWQLLAGVRAPLTDNMDVGIKYRMFTAEDVGLVDTLGRDFDGKLRSHSLLGTFTFNFGAPEVVPVPAPVAPPPPPPPPPPPAPVVQCNTGPYIVFFDWDRSDITAEAATVLDNAVSSYRNCGNASVMLAGHTDRSGSAQYNMGLAQRRNASVRDYLTGRGVPGGRISSEAFGESQPRVPTADGVREPQNRRVEITYGPGSGM